MNLLLSMQKKSLFKDFSHSLISILVISCGISCSQKNDAQNNQHSTQKNVSTLEISTPKTSIDLTGSGTSLKVDIQFGQYQDTNICLFVILRTNQGFYRMQGQEGWFDLNEQAIQKKELPWGGQFVCYEKAPSQILSLELFSLTSSQIEIAGSEIFILWGKGAGENAFTDAINNQDQQSKIGFIPSSRDSNNHRFTVYSEKSKIDLTATIYYFISTKKELLKTEDLDATDSIYYMNQFKRIVKRTQSTDIDQLSFSSFKLPKEGFTFSEIPAEELGLQGTHYIHIGTGYGNHPFEEMMSNKRFVIYKLVP